MPPFIAFAGVLGGLAVVRWAYKTAQKINQELEEMRLARVAEHAQRHRRARGTRGSATDLSWAQSSRRESLRTTKPAASRVPPPARSRTTSRPVNGSVPLLTVELGGHDCGLYAWHVELPDASAVPGSIITMPRTTSVAILLMSPFQ